MPSHSLSKIQKSIAQKKGKNPVLHERSRTARRLKRAGGREDRLAKSTNAREKRNQPLLERVLFFQNRTQGNNSAYSVDDMHIAVIEYLNRNEDELSSIKSERRPGRPASTREDLLVRSRDLEGKEYESGLWMPDLQDAANINTLSLWNGDWGPLSTISFCRISKNGTTKPSKFPPDGLS